MKVPEGSKVIWYTNDQGRLSYIIIRATFGSYELEKWLNRVEKHIAVMSNYKIKFTIREKDINDEINIKLLYDKIGEVFKDSQIYKLLK